MTTLMPKDADNNPIPALRLKPGGAHRIDATAASAKNAAAFDPATKVIGIYADGPIAVALGGASVSVSDEDHYIPAGLYYDIAISGGMNGAQASHIAVLAMDGDCIVYISEKE